MVQFSTRSTNRSSAVSARERARQVMAGKRAAELEREKAIEDALATVLMAAEDEHRVAQRRRDAVVAARAAYDKAMAEVNRRSGQALHRMRALDESVASIAAMTGLSRPRIAELIRLADKPTTPAPNGSPVAPARPVKSTVSDCRVAPLDPDP